MILLNDKVKPKAFQKRVKLLIKEHTAVSFSNCTVQYF